MGNQGGEGCAICMDHQGGSKAPAQIQAQGGDLYLNITPTAKGKVIGHEASQERCVVHTGELGLYGLAKKNTWHIECGYCTSSGWMVNISVLL